MLCARCRQRHGTEGIPLAQGAVALMSRLMTESLDSLAAGRPNRAELAPVRQLLDRFLLYHLGVHPGRKSLSFVHQVEQSPSLEER